MDKLKQIESFAAVATKGSLMAAANAEGVAPAGVGRGIDALEERLGGKLMGRTTRVADIAARAGFSVGAVYSRFHDKIGVLHCLQDRFVEEAHLTTDVTLDPERWEGAGINEIVSELVAFLVQIYREGGGVLRELMVHTRSEPQMVERKERLAAHVSDRLCALLLPRAERIRNPDPATAVAFGLRLVFATCEQAILFGEGGIVLASTTSDEDLVFALRAGDHDSLATLV